MNRREPDFFVYTTVGAPGPRRPREVGVAFWNQEQGRVVVCLDALPVSGRLILSARRQGIQRPREVGEEG